MTLLIGYGNPGRGDDGLGPALADRIAARGLPGVTVTQAYQLTVDHAMPVAAAQRVIFADAWIGATAPYRLAPVAASATAELTSHALRPEAVLALAATLYGAAPQAHVLAIAGHDFDRVHEGLGERARANLDLAEAFLLDWLAKTR